LFFRNPYSYNVAAGGSLQITWSRQ
jgi:hypothetical protein